MANPLYGVTSTSSLVGGFSITPNDSTDLATATREMYFAGAGNVNVTWVGGETSVHAVLAGERLPWAVTRVLSTSTTATGIEGFY